MNNKFFPGIRHSADELSAYTVTCDVFILFLKNNAVAYVYTTSEEEFRAWLKKHKIGDVSAAPGNNYAAAPSSRRGIKKMICDVFAKIKK